MTTNTTDRKAVIRNGVNVKALAASTAAIQQQPELAQFKFRARIQWDTGGHNVATVNDFLLRKSPVYDTLANPVKIKIEVKKVWSNWSTIELRGANSRWTPPAMVLEGADTSSYRISQSRFSRRTRSASTEFGFITTNISMKHQA